MTPAADVKWDQAAGAPPMATMWGDRMKGAHGTFLKLPAGMVSPMHTHSIDDNGIVIAGTVSHQVQGQPDGSPLGPGSYWFMPAKVPHISKCAAGADCLVFIVQPGKFDYVPVK